MSICRKPFVLFVPILVAAFICSGCASSPRFATRNAAPSSPAGGNGTESRPADPPKTTRNPSGKVLLTLEGVASYYADDYHGKVTSNGEVFNMNDLTAAHRTFPFGTNVRVTNLENKKTVIVRINDRGPFKDGRIIDLSLAAARELDLVRNGTARVKLEVLEWGDGK
jgi:rare lipoprotein A